MMMIDSKVLLPHCDNIQNVTSFITHMAIYDTRAQNPLILAFLWNHILHCICFKILFTVSKYLVSNWSYTRLIGRMKKVKKLNKKFQIFRVFIIVHNHYFLILKLFRVIKGFILYQTKQTALKSGYKFRSYDKFTDTCWIEELKTWKPLSPIWASRSISRKRQTTGFEPLHHIYARNIFLYTYL